MYEGTKDYKREKYMDDAKEDVNIINFSKKELIEKLQEMLKISESNGDFFEGLKIEKTIRLIQDNPKFK